ncbi:YraN family protein [Desulfotomaculum defluvii]
MTLQRKALGKKGEEEACKFIHKLGYRLLERNYRCKLGELDIIAWDPIGMLVFLEVRSRSGNSFGIPEESINSTKKNKLRVLARYFLMARSEFTSVSCRFDIVAVHFNRDGEVKKINHIKNAF